MSDSTDRAPVVRIPIHPGWERGDWDEAQVAAFLDALIPDPRLRSVVGGALTSTGARIRSASELVGFSRALVDEVLGSPSPEFRAAAEVTRDRLETFVENNRALSQDPARRFWPNPERDPAQALLGQLPTGARRPLVNERTRVASAGSCFARQIALSLQRQGFNYLVEERLDRPGAGVVHEGAPLDGCVAASAAWGTIYNTPSFRQLAEKAFGLRSFPRILLGPSEHPSSAPYQDPFRQAVRFESEEAYERDYDGHVAACRRALERCEVFIMTLGLTECWEYTPGECALSGALMTPSLLPLLRRRTLGFQENLDNLQRFSDILREHNPGVEIIVSVSPVPLKSTHRAETDHVVTANHFSKCVLRAVAEQLSADNPHVHYLPSYEVVTYCSPDPYQPDQRHIRQPAVENVMRLFSEMFVDGEGVRAAPAPSDAGYEKAQAKRATVVAS